MRSALRNNIVKLLFAALFAVAVPLGFALGFRTNIHPILIIIFPLVRVSLVFVIKITRGRTKKIFKTLSSLSGILFALFVLAGILITPYSSYSIWLETVQSGSASGTVSNIIVLLTSMFSGFFGSMILTVDWVWPFLGMSLTLLSLLAFIYQKAFIYFILMIIVLLCLLYLSVKYGYKSRRIRGFFLLIHLSAAALLFAFGLTALTGRGTPKGSNLVDAGLYPFLRQTVLDIFPSYPLLYAIPGYGFSFDETGRLGGKAVLSPAPIFEITGGKGARLYLKTRSYDNYDGTTWQISTLSDEEIPDNIIFESKQPEAEEIKVTLLTEYYRYLPFNLDTVRIRFEEEAPELEYGNLETGFVLKDPIRRGTAFYLQTAKKNMSLEDPSPFLQAPAVLPDEIHFLAGRIGAGIEDPTVILSRIERYLAVNYSYTLEAEMDRGYEDFVGSFLFEKLEGYCVHFATSFVILARLNGIPTRYSTGFLVNRSETDQAFEVTGFSAHAWPEVWLEGSGWAVWEATPALNPSNYQRVEDYWIYKLDMEFRGLTARQLRNILGDVRPADYTEASSESRFSVWSAAIPTAAVIIVALVLWLILHYKPWRRRKKPPEYENRTLSHSLLRVVKLLERNGLKGPEASGWIHWRDELEQKIPDLARSIHNTVRIVLESIYGGKHAGQEEISSIRNLYGDIRDNLI